MTPAADEATPRQISDAEIAAQNAALSAGIDRLSTTALAIRRERDELLAALKEARLFYVGPSQSRARIDAIIAKADAPLAQAAVSA